MKKFIFGQGRIRPPSWILDMIFVCILSFILYEIQLGGRMRHWPNFGLYRIKYGFANPMKCVNLLILYTVK